MTDTSAINDADAAAQPQAAARPASLLVLVFVSVSFGLAFGIYDLLLPLYWESRNISFTTMGYLFSIAAAVIFVMRIYVGRLSDRFGRKPFYTASLVVSGLANLATPLLPHIVMQGVLKTSREMSALVRDTMHSILLYERDSKTFMGAVGITRGAEFTCHGIGSLMAGAIAAAMAVTASQPNYRAPFAVSAILVLIATVAFAFFFKPAPADAPAVPARKAATLHELLSTDLPPKLWLLVAFGFTFEVGIWATHCFVMQLYFKGMLNDTLQISATQMIFGLGVIFALHRLTSGIPMMLIGPRLKKNLKWLFILFVFSEGVALAAAPLIPNPWIALAVWLTHDLFGAGIWSPIHHHYIQKYSRPHRRGSDVSKVMALGQLGQIAGPLLASFLLAHSAPGYLGAPFIVGGIIISLSSLILLKL